ncbi:MAG TPA: hypothetical protein VHO94_04335 [Oscillospiraceae bacterium]|nr:hypothetical protein [Oscillospiraceae bacterium]
MKTNSHSLVVCKKVDDIIYTKDEEKRREVKTTQYFLPNINFNAATKMLKVLLLILLLISILCFNDKIKEAAPIITAFLEQLH